MRYCSKIGWLVVAVLMFFSTTAPLCAQQDELRTRILFVLDGSGSMDNMWGDGKVSRISSAKKILIEVADSLSNVPNLELGLRVYGHQSPVGYKNCTDTRLEVGFSKNSTKYIKDKLRYIDPKGTTPIAYALTKAGADFPAADGRNIIILLTDGEEACGGDPCAVARALEKKGVILKHFVIGLGVDDRAMTTFGCIGEAFNTRNQESLRSSLSGILTRILKSTTSQVDLLNDQGKQAYTNLPMTLYNPVMNRLEHAYYHTLDEKGNPDTLYIDPVLKYDLMVHTVPPVSAEGLVLNTETHNHLKAKTASGTLTVGAMGKSGNTLSQVTDRIKCLVIDPETGNTIAVQGLGEELELLTGSYKLELLTLPRKTFNDVRIKEGEQTAIQIPNPGIVNIAKKYAVYGGIFVRRENALLRVLSLGEGEKSEQVALQPGDYFIIYRSQRQNNMHSTKTLPFSVASGESITLTIE